MRLLPLALFIALLSGTVSAQAQPFTLSSSDIKADSRIGNDFAFNNYGCTGKNISPALNWDNMPNGTQSFAITMFDPDAPAAGGWWHWIMYNLTSNSTGVPTGMGSGAMGIPKHVKQVTNSYGNANYGGPCPPVGSTHRYVFTVYALKVDWLDIPENTPVDKVLSIIEENMIEKTSFTATYGR